MSVLKLESRSQEFVRCSRRSRSLALFFLCTLCGVPLAAGQGITNLEQGLSSRQFSYPHRSLPDVSVEPVSALPQQQEPGKESEESPEKAAQELWQKVLAAKGGLDALSAIKTRTSVSQVTLAVPPETMSGTAETYVSYPDKLAINYLMGGQNFFDVIAGADLWIGNARASQITVMSAIVKKGRGAPKAVEMTRALQTDPIGFFVLASDDSSQRQLLDPVEGMPGLLVTLKTEDRFKAYFDPETFLLKRLICDDYRGEVTSFYSDYRTIAGVQVPFKIEIRQGSEKVREETITEFKENAPIPKQVFTRPQIEEER